MNTNQDKSKPIPHYNPIRFIVGSLRGGDKKFLGGNGVLLRKLLQDSEEKT